MRVGIVGLGLIGGSFAKAYHESKDWEVYGMDSDKRILDLALLAEDLDGVLDETTISQCDLLLIALYPQAVIEYLEKNAPYISKDTVVIDCGGTKSTISEAGSPIAEKYGFTFIGGHPMAGRHYTGYKYSLANLYDGMAMVIIPKTCDDMNWLEHIKDLLKPARFGTVTVTTAENHDKMIAFTSQLAHVVSNAYIKSPTAREHHGYSAGSYKDLTRVAWLNEVMWTELFMENRDYLTEEIRFLREELKKYQNALEQQDFEKMRELLREGKERKVEVDGR